MGVPFDNCTMDEAVERAKELLRQEKTAYCVTPNSEIVYTALRNPELMELIRGADLVLPDGAGVVLASRILKTPLKQKVAGVDFSGRLLDVLAEDGKRLYLLGSKPGVAEQAAAKMIEGHPGLVVCGTADGYFRDEDPVVEKINESGADVLFVCLGAPKQEFFMKRHQEDLHVSLMAGLGGSLDAYAGTVKRAPRWMIRLNLEWFYRLVKEPKRLGRMMCLPKFILTAVWWRIRGKK